MLKEEKKQRMLFDESGKIIAVDGTKVEPKNSSKVYSQGYYSENTPYTQRRRVSTNSDSQRSFFHKKHSHSSHPLKTSDSLEFLKEDNSPPLENIFENKYWDLNEDDQKIKPLLFSNGKTQEDVVKEIVNLIESGKKVIFLHGVCGSGKSAIALNVARTLNGKSAVVVPLKNLQRQYEQDYLGKKYLNSITGRKLKIAMITGRDNHDSVVMPGVSCAHPELPENIKITEKNYSKIVEYCKENPYYEGESLLDLEEIKRLNIAPSNPYWSPILPAEFDIPYFKSVKKYKYKGVNGKEFIFYHRKEGCSYYDQFLAYVKADIIIFNAAKYKLEMAMGRKPKTDVDIIDEADDFLDGLFDQDELNLTRLASSLKMIPPNSLQTKEAIDEALELITLEEKNKKALGIDENQIFHISETKIESILKAISKNTDLESLILLDEINYSNKALEIANNFKSLYSEVYVTYRKDEENLYVKLVSTNLSSKVRDLLDKSKALVFMSGTLHSQNIVKKIFKITDYSEVKAETLNLGNIEINMTRKEMDCRYASMKSDASSREKYLDALSTCLQKATNPTLIHVQSFFDLPNESEKQKYDLHNLMTSEKLKEIQNDDKTGRSISMFKSGLSKEFFSTRASRGVDFPGDMCRSIVFTKYPNPNVSDTFWKILQKTHPDEYWEFYKDKAYREFLQRIYRAVRSKDDHVFILSPDIRVIEEVRKLQKEMDKR